MNFLLYQYTYSLNNPYVNLGDYVQTLATKNALERLYGMKNLYSFFDRDALSYYPASSDGSKPICVMQGWFSDTRTWLPNHHVIPICVGMHMNSINRTFLRQSQAARDQLAEYQLGARDPSTCAFFKEIGLHSYYSRCLTLTFPKRDHLPPQPQCFIVDVPERLVKYIPQNILSFSEFSPQREIGRGESDQFHQAKYMKMAENLLEKYKTRATLVITSALHCAMPCIAMGIPTIFIDPEKHKGTHHDRFAVASDIVPIYGEKDLRSGNVNWTPTPPDIEELKQDMLLNLDMTIKQALGETIDEGKLVELRHKIGLKREDFQLQTYSGFSNFGRKVRHLIAAVLYFVGRKINA